MPKDPRGFTATPRYIEKPDMKRSNSVFFKPGRPPKCTVQIVDATEKKAKHVAKFTVYADARRTKDAIELALIDWEKQENT